jgi:hypothetical protein
MGWSIGERNGRDIGYGVPAICDHPNCNKRIDRGLSYLCGGDIDSDKGCGLYFCRNHLYYGPKSRPLCEKCLYCRKPFSPKPDLLAWVYFKMVDPSWQLWREENKLTPKDLEMEEEWNGYGLVLEPTTCTCDGNIHDVNCKWIRTQH